MSVPEATRGGKFNYYWQNGSDHEGRTITVDFNCNIKFKRKEGEKHNNISVYNEKTKYEISRVPNSMGVSAAPIFSGDERFALAHIFNIDKNPENFSIEDFNYLKNNRNKDIKLNDKYVYRVIATDQEIANGKVKVELRDILHDKSTKKTGRTIIIDIETQAEATPAKNADAPPKNQESKNTSFLGRFLSQ